MCFPEINLLYRSIIKNTIVLGADMSAGAVGVGLDEGRTTAEPNFINCCSYWSVCQRAIVSKDLGWGNPKRLSALTNIITHVPAHLIWQSCISVVFDQKQNWKPFLSSKIKGLPISTLIGCALSETTGNYLGWAAHLYPQGYTGSYGDRPSQNCAAKKLGLRVRNILRPCHSTIGASFPTVKFCE